MRPANDLWLIRSIEPFWNIFDKFEFSTDRTIDDETGIILSSKLQMNTLLQLKFNLKVSNVFLPQMFFYFQRKRGKTFVQEVAR